MARSYDSSEDEKRGVRHRRRERSDEDLRKRRDTDRNSESEVSEKEERPDRERRRERNDDESREKLSRRREERVGYMDSERDVRRRRREERVNHGYMDSERDDRRRRREERVNHGYMVSERDDRRRRHGRDAEIEENGHMSRKEERYRDKEIDREDNRKGRHSDYGVKDEKIGHREYDRGRDSASDRRDRSRRSEQASEDEEEEGEFVGEDCHSKYTKKEQTRDRERDRRHHENGDKYKRRSNKDGIRKGDSNEKDDPNVQIPEKEVGIDAVAISGRSGGVYIPPYKVARMMSEVEDKTSVEYQRLTWDALRKSINGLVNKVNATNIKNIIPELFAENLIRGRGLFCRSCMKSQMASPGFTDVFAALVAVVNNKFPKVGNLLLRRVIVQYKRSFKRNDKPKLLAVVKFIAHLVNQQVVSELVALELLTGLLEKPTDDSVEVAAGFVTECGSLLQDLCAQGLDDVFEGFRGILHEGDIDKRVQFLIENLFALRKSKFQGHPAVRPELDLVDQEDTHVVSLDDEMIEEQSLDVFKPDPQFTENEKRYEELKKQILGEESEEEADLDEDAADSDDEDEEQMRIKDETETNLVNLRRTIYLTIMSSVDFEEAGHKLLKIKLEPGQEMELCIMLLECCSQERTYLRYYGLLGQRFCMINKVHQENFEMCFVQQYSMIHRLETNKLRNVAKFFAHLLGTDALPCHALAYIRLTEEDTTSSSRIFIKILFQELSEHLGIRLLNERLSDPAMQESFDSIFPKDNPKNTRFAINFFTSIGLGGITENLREYLKSMPKIIMQQKQAVSNSGSKTDSSSNSDSEGSGSSSRSSESETDSDDRRRKRKRRN